MKYYRIWGRPVPCTKFIGNMPELSEEKRKEMWVEVVCDDPDMQEYINQYIGYHDTFANDIYKLLSHDHRLELRGSYTKIVGKEVV